MELGVTWEKKGDGGIDLKVVRLGGALTKANTTTMTVKVVPVGPDATDAYDYPAIAAAPPPEDSFDGSVEPDLVPTEIEPR